MNLTNKKVCNFTVTYKPDLELLKIQNKSVHKFCKNYSGFYYVIDDNNFKDDNDEIRNFLLSQQSNKIYKSSVCYPVEQQIHNGYIRQQYIKLRCDKYIEEDFDWVCMVDSDCVFFENNWPDMYFIDNKPIMLITPYESINETVPWKKTTEKFLQDRVDYEFMRRMPLIYPNFIFDEFREWVRKSHRQSLLDYLKQQKKFSEFNALGAYIYKYHRDLYTWIDTSCDEFKYLPVLQIWSYGEIDYEFLNNLVDYEDTHDTLKKIINMFMFKKPYFDYRNSHIKKAYQLLHDLRFPKEES